MKIIHQIGTAKFKVTTPNVPSSDLELDFNPLIKQFKLAGNYLLIHWQARPKGYREWGIYSSKDDSYRSVAKLTINLAITESLQLDDKTARTIPSAVLCSREDEITCINQKAVIGKVFLSDVA